MKYFYLILLAVLSSVFSFAGDLAIPPVHAPTLYFEKTPPRPSGTPKPAGPILLDARAGFDYAMGHLPQAINIRSEDYCQTDEAHKGALDPDLDLLSRKLSYLGVSPSRDVIVMGGGLKGHGEEGRIGWMLNYLGIKKVRVTSFDEVPGKRSVDTDFQNKSAPPWTVNRDVSLRVIHSELLKIINERSAVIIDVRSFEEFHKGHIPGAINIVWTEFLNKTGSPLIKNQVESLFKSRKLNSNQTFIFYSADGISSGYATFVTYNAGLHARHYDGSFKEWSSDPHAVIEK